MKIQIQIQIQVYVNTDTTPLLTCAVGQTTNQRHKHRHKFKYRCKFKYRLVLPPLHYSQINTNQINIFETTNVCSAFLLRRIFTLCWSSLSDLILAEKAWALVPMCTALPLPI